jgi:hypothetical protein
MHQLVERGLFLKFRMNPQAINAEFLSQLRDYLYAEKRDYLDAYYSSLCRRLATDEIEAEALIEELDKMPLAYKNRSDAKAIRADHCNLIRGRPLGAAH